MDEKPCDDDVEVQARANSIKKMHVIYQDKVNKAFRGKAGKMRRRISTARGGKGVR